MRNIALSLILLPAIAMAGGVENLLSRLSSVDCYQATADYQVLMSLQDDVDYRVELMAQRPVMIGDTLSPCDYLIRWHAAGEDGPGVNGFSAYFAGNVYNFRGDRMAEYHMPADSVAFRPSGRTGAIIPGIQRRTQFVNLLPQYIADEIRHIMATPDEYTWAFTPDTIVDSQACSAFTAVQSFGGNVYREVTYLFDSTIGMPLYSQMENNPGALAEQTIVTRYNYPTATKPCPPINEYALRKAYPDVFDHMRSSTFAIDHLVGQPLPGFSLPTTTGERHTYTRGDGFKAPTIVVLADATASFAAPTVEAVRGAVAMLPFNVDVIWAFVGNNTTDIEEVVAQPEMDEYLLMSARSLARDCGASSLPVIIIAGRDGSVTHVFKGYTPELSASLIQSLRN